MKRLALIAAFVVGVSPFVRAQSLADAAELARKAHEAAAAAAKSDAKPESKKADGKKADGKKDSPTSQTVFTNADLKDTPGPAIVQPSDAQTAATIASRPPVESAEADRAEAYRTVAKKDEAYWKTRMADAQSTLDTDRLHLDAMTVRVNPLSADFNNSSSISQRAVLRQQREDAATEATRLKAAVASDRTMINRIEEEARRANVPPGWLRP